MLKRVEMLNRRAQSPEFKANQVIKSLDIKKGSTIVDIGAGGGFYSMNFAAETGLNGKVYAVDMNKDYLNYIKKEAEKSGLTNIETISVTGEWLGLPHNGCDLIFLRNSYHHIPEPQKYFMRLKQYMNHNSKVVIIDYKKAKKFSFINLMRHYVNQDEIIECMKTCGFKHIKSYDFIEQQSFNIFQV